MLEEKAVSGQLSGRVFIIAEMANAHEGNPEAAEAIIRHAAAAGADAVKFQAIEAAELAVPSHSNYALYRKLAMAETDWGRLIHSARELNLAVFADVFGAGSADLMHRLGVDGFELHAADATNHPLLQHVAGLGRPVILSVSGTTWLETAEALEVLQAGGAGKRGQSPFAGMARRVLRTNGDCPLFPAIVLMYGFQGYPTPLEDSNLRRLRLLAERFPVTIGYSSHADGGSPDAVTLPALAVAAGAQWVEVHLTLDRSRKGLDYYSSLDPPEFAAMVQGVRRAELCLGPSSWALAAAERRYRDVHRKRLVAVREIAAGETLTAENAALRRAETAADCSTADLPLALGRRAARAIPQYSPIGMKDLKMKIVAVLACRAESSRLYGKPLQLVGDRPIIQHLLDRLAQVKSLDGICLAISQGPSAEIFIDYARKRQLDYVVGPEKDVLGRLILGADHCGADVILRTTTENPYTYWENIDDLIRLHVEKGADLTVTEKLPLGTLVEIISVDALKRSHKFGEDRHRSELCSMFIAEHPEAFVIQRVAPPEKLCRPEIRLTVDTPYDLVFVRTLWEALHQPDRLIRLEEIVDFCDAHPEVAKMNAGEQTLYLWK